MPLLCNSRAHSSTPSAYSCEVREYLLEKYGRRCAYCGKENAPLEVEHIVPKSRGGTDWVSNLTIACHDCNQEKGNLTAEEYARFKGADFSQVIRQASAPSQGRSSRQRNSLGLV
jgi:5-methylcytosine-specific restriction endonuclease McrA